MSTSSSWTYRNPVEVRFGPGRLAELAGLARGHVMLVTSPGATSRGLTDQLAELIGPQVRVFDRVEPIPSLALAESALRTARNERIDMVVAVGGGSAIDVGKVVSIASAATPVSIQDLRDATGWIRSLHPVPLIAVPTTAGTGAEVTPFATLWDVESGKKLSFGTPELFAQTAIVDPTLALSLPWEATLASGLDAYTQCFEAIWNRRATPVTTAIATRGLTRVPDALRELRVNPDNLQARSDMAEAALLSGLAISQTRTALAHSMSCPLTAHFGLPHGLACAVVLPAVAAFNAVKDDGRMHSLARELGVGDAASLAPMLAELLGDLGVPSSVAGYLPDFAAANARASEMLTPGRADNNVREANEEDVQTILASTHSWLAGGRAVRWVV